MEEELEVDGGVGEGRGWESVDGRSGWRSGGQLDETEFKRVSAREKCYQPTKHTIALCKLRDYPMYKGFVCK